MAFLSASVLAQGRPTPSSSDKSVLLHCLGAEEKFYHAKKRLGALYDLNQRMIGEILQVPGLEGAADVLRDACKPGEATSLVVLEAILLHPNEWYAVAQGHQLGEVSIMTELLKEIIIGAPEMFLTFLGQLQSEAPTPDCLEKQIPGLKELYSDVKWLQEDVDPSKLVGNKGRLRYILRTIRDPEVIFAKCRVKPPQSKAKSKKTDKGAGMPSAQ